MMHANARVPDLRRGQRIVFSMLGAAVAKALAVVAKLGGAASSQVGGNNLHRKWRENRGYEIIESSRLEISIFVSGL